jgi:hypothetical protein
MSVDPEISRRIIEEELRSMAPLVDSYGWEMTSDLSNNTVTVKMKSIVDSEVYILEAKCDDYKELPPFFEFIYPDTGERGTKLCYPADGSFFHANPCICVEWSRKAYAVHGGPHNDWQMANWIKARPGMTTLGDFFHLVQRQINNKEKYKGRMKP